MKFSVVIPLYNKRAYIGRAIQSVLDQTYSPDEIIIVDDGSTDGSNSEVEKFESEKICLISQPNSGVGAARNRGVKEAKNDFIAFLDADDEWKIDFLATILSLLDDYPGCGAYACGSEIINGYHEIYNTTPSSLEPLPWRGKITNYFYHIQYGGLLHSSSIMVPKVVLNKLKGFPEGISMGEDRLFWIKLGMNYPIAYSSFPQSRYYLDIPDSAMKKPVSSYPVTAGYIEDLFAKNEVPEKLANDVKDYLAYLKIQRAYHLILSARGSEARSLLRTIGPNRKYDHKKFKWWFWSYIPNSIFELTQTFKYKFIRVKK